jgi:hypothetical protein
MNCVSITSERILQNTVSYDLVYGTYNNGLFEKGEAWLRCAAACALYTASPLVQKRVTHYQIGNMSTKKYSLDNLLVQSQSLNTHRDGLKRMRRGVRMILLIVKLCV